MKNLKDYKNHCVFDCETKKKCVNTLHENIIDYDVHMDIKLSGHTFYDSDKLPFLKSLLSDVVKLSKNTTKKKMKSKKTHMKRKSEKK